MISSYSNQRQNLSQNLAIAIKHLSLHGLRYSMASLWREIWFDLVKGVDTASPQYPDLPNHSIQYQGADPQVVKEIFNAIPERAKEATFVDFGCGKGRTLIIALEHGFREVIGVEIAPELASICQSNLSKVAGNQTGATFRIIQADATTFELPNGPITAFFFNPFNGPPLEQVALNLKNNAARTGSEVWLIYVNPLHLNTFIEQGFKVVHSLTHRKTLLAVVAHMQPNATP
ncbi:MAG: putative RNA methylase [Verrucomicrobia bacterium]|nr:MAG: putative RNA methylase [Verrucomicrobiota bacterium]